MSAGTSPSAYGAGDWRRDGRRGGGGEREGGSGDKAIKKTHFRQAGTQKKKDFTPLDVSLDFLLSWKQISFLFCFSLFLLGVSCSVATSASSELLPQIKLR